MNLLARSDQIIEYFQELRKNYDPVQDMQKIRAGIEKEAEFVKGVPAVCNAREVKQLQQLSYGIDYDKVKKVFQKTFDEGEVTRFTGCLILSDTLMVDENGKLVEAEDISRSFEDLVQVGDASAFGTVLRGRLHGQTGFYLLKIAQSRENNGEELMQHELLVGSFLNRLRAMGIPNFTYTYGTFRCSPPVFDNQGRVIHWCGESKEMVTYVIYEDIEKANNCLAYLARDPNLSALYSLFLQIALATQTTNDIFPYTHYDLHPENILMRSAQSLGFQDSFYIPYQSKQGREYFVLADRIATIIDYGSVYVDGYGTPEVASELHGRFRDVNAPLQDIYKLLSFLGLVFLEKSTTPRPVKNMLLYFLQFFTGPVTENKALVFLTQQKRVNHNLPPSFIPQGTDLNSFINHLFRIPNNILGAHLRDRLVTRNPQPGNPILRCRTCYSFEQVLQKVSAGNDQGKHPQTFYDVYRDAFLESSDKDTDIDVDRATELMLDELTTLRNEARALRTQFRPVDLTSRNFYDEDTLRAFRKFYFSLFSLYNILTKVVQMERVLTWVSEDRGLNLDSLLQQVRLFLASLNKSIQAALPSIALSVRTIEDEQRTDAFRSLVMRNRAYLWYINILESLRVLIADQEKEDVEMTSTNSKEITWSAPKRQSIIATQTGEIFRRNKLKRDQSL